MTLRSRSRRHRSPPQIAFVQIFSSPGFRSSPATSSHVRGLAPPFSIHLAPVQPPLETSSAREKPTRPDSKLRICFSTSLFTFSRRCAQHEREKRKGKRVLSPLHTLSHSLPPFSLFLCPPFSFLFRSSSFLCFPPPPPPLRPAAFRSTARFLSGGQ